MSNKKSLAPKILVPLLLFCAAVLLAVFFVLTRRDGADIAAEPDDPAPVFAANGAGDAEQEELSPQPLTPAPRWFRSNAGGMALEEIPSRLVALRNRHALVIDFINPYELEPFLKPFFGDGFAIELRVLFEHGEETRRQWLFLDEAGRTRLNASFRHAAEETEKIEDGFFDFALLVEYLTDDVDEYPDSEETEATPYFAEVPANIAAATSVAPVGFIEVFDEYGRVVRDYLFAEDGAEILTSFFYNDGLLIRAETKRRESGELRGEFRNIHTDHFRYNRSHSLRYVLRVFYEPEDAQPIRLAFSDRLLDAAFQDGFIGRVVTPGVDFIETFFDAGDGFSVRYETDSRGRVLTQTMLDEHGEIVWKIQNTWEGERIAAMSRTEDGEERRTEFEFDGGGNRIVQREMRNGVIERVVRSYGVLEIEELYMDGVLALRAVWEGGRRISEERVRH